LFFVRGISKRVAALAVAGATAAGLVVAGAGAASADVSGGTVTLTLNESFIAQLAKDGVVVVPQNAASVTVDSADGTVSIAFTATGGLGDLTYDGGTVNLSGSLLAFSLRGRCVTLSSLEFDLGNASFDGATSSGADTPLLDVAGTEVAGIVLPNETLTASQLTIDAAGAALLDGALHTSAFTAGANVGSFSAAWTVTPA
jgi:hypothetical protein